MNKVAVYFGTIRVNNSLLFLYFLCKIQNNCLAKIHYFLSNIINTKINFIFYIELPRNVFVIKNIYIGSCYYLLFAVYSRTDRRVGSKNIACHPSIQYHTSIDLKLADGKGGGYTVLEEIHF